jgi:hypothetical protein
MDQISCSNLGKNSRKNARPDYPARGPDNQPPGKFPKSLLRHTNLIDREEWTYNKIHEGQEQQEEGQTPRTTIGKITP